MINYKVMLLVIPAVLVGVSGCANKKTYTPPTQTQAYTPPPPPVPTNPNPPKDGARYLVIKDKSTRVANNRGTYGYVNFEGDVEFVIGRNGGDLNKAIELIIVDEMKRRPFKLDYFSEPQGGGYEYWGKFPLKEFDADWGCMVGAMFSDDHKLLKVKFMENATTGVHRYDDEYRSTYYFTAKLVQE